MKLFYFHIISSKFFHLNIVTCLMSFVVLCHSSRVARSTFEMDCTSVCTPLEFLWSGILRSFILARLRFHRRCIHKNSYRASSTCLIVSEMHCSGCNAYMHRLTMVLHSSLFSNYSFVFNLFSTLKEVMFSHGHGIVQ